MKSIIAKLDPYSTPGSTEKKLDPYTQSKVDAMRAEKNLTLDLIGFKQGTDKASLAIGKDGPRRMHDYLRHYDFLFNSFRNDELAIVEFGCLGGASLRMWNEYFPKAEIYGVDLDEKVKRFEGGRIHIVIGDATHKETYDALEKQLGDRKPMIILDDASHAWGDQRRSLELFWSLLAPGGFYVVEDLECPSAGVFPQYPPAVLDAQPFINYLFYLCESLRWAPDRGYHYPAEYTFKQLPKIIQEIKLSLDALYLIPGTAILRKRVPPLPH